MDKIDQIHLVEALSNAVVTKLLRDMERIPKDWDGIELRQLLADHFVTETVKMDRRRRIAYNSVVLERNL